MTVTQQHGAQGRAGRDLAFTAEAFATARDAAVEIAGAGGSVTLAQLRTYLDITQQMNPVPELHLQPDPNARYELVDEVLAVTKHARVEKMGFVGNEAYVNAF